jgi:hypothetical protein
MDKPHRLSHLNEIVTQARKLGVPVADVWFGWGFDMLVIMRHSLPEPMRLRYARGPGLEYALVDFDAHYPGWGSYHEVLIDRECKVAIIFPRPPELLEAHKAELRAKAGV